MAILIVKMNFLAHLHLAGQESELIVGNFIADHVKGKKIDAFPDKVRHGIRMHRFIDEYTDNHDTVERSKKLLRPSFGKFSGIIVDMFYDHILATNWSDFSNQALAVFIQQTYDLLAEHAYLFPPTTSQMFPYMIRENWLLRYRRVHGIQQSLKGMDSRFKFPSNMADSIPYLEKHMAQFTDDFLEFYPQLQAEVAVFKDQSL